MIAGQSLFLQPTNYENEFHDTVIFVPWRVDGLL